jgi:transcriptional regulator with XRE-family HTH domain
MCINDLTLKEIAEKTSYPLSTISTWKRGRIPRDKSVLECLAKIFNTTTEQLFSNGNQFQVFANEAQFERKQLTSEQKLKEYIETLISQNDDILIKEIYQRLSTEFPVKKLKKRLRKNRIMS